MFDFAGFARPTSNYYRLPNDWFEIWQHARQTSAQGDRPARILAPLKVTEYVIKHTWGWSNFDEPLRLSRSDLREGRRGKGGRRLDLGTGLGSEATLSRGINLALSLGMLEQIEINDDPARMERLYLPQLSSPAEEEIPAADGMFTGFSRPERNYFIVPKSWIDFSAGIGSEVLILSVEYFFRHTWGWQMREGEIRWLDVDEVANGRRYRSHERQGKRYDQGIGYTTRQVRRALEQGVQRGFLVWRYQETSGKEYALRMGWMEGVRSEGYYDSDDQIEANTSTANKAKISLSQFVPHEQDQKSVGGQEKDVGPTEKITEGEEKSVEGEEKSVGGREKGVGGAEKSVGEQEKDVGRTYKDTLTETLNQNTSKTTATTTHRQSKDEGANVVAVDVQNENFLIFFRPELEDEKLGTPRQLMPDEATSIILIERGEWYWSEDDLAHPKQVDSEVFSPQEIAAQITLDKHLFDDDRAILDDGHTVRLLSLTEIARLLAANNRLTQPVIYYDLWRYLDLPPPTEAERLAEYRREKMCQFQTQAEAWGDPDLIAALEQINISPDQAHSFIAHNGAGIVGGWLQALRTNPDGVKNMAAVLISCLQKEMAPPGGPMPVVECSPINLTGSSPNGRPGELDGDLETTLARIAGLLTGLTAELQSLAQVQPDPRLSTLADIFRQAQEIVTTP